MRHRASPRALHLFVLFSLLVATFAPVFTPAAAQAADTPAPTTVTLVGDLQAEIGCGGDWDPTCAASYLAYNAEDDVWQQTFTPPAGSYEYKAALNNGWDENYGANAAQNGPNIVLTADGSPVKFYYDHKSHWITSSRNATIAVAPGSFQSELGCAGDLGCRLPALLAAGPGRRRHVYVLDFGAAGRQLRRQGCHQRGLGPQLWRRRRAERAQHRLCRRQQRRPRNLQLGQQHQGAVDPGEFDPAARHRPGRHRPDPAAQPGRRRGLLLRDARSLRQRRPVQRPGRPQRRSPGHRL